VSSWNDSVLRVMLDKLSKDEIIDLLISTIKMVCGDDEKSIKNVTHAIVCHAQCTEIMAGRSKLEEHQEPHKEELFGLLLTNYLPAATGSLDKKTISVFYADYTKSKLSFLEWIKSFPNP